MRKFLFAVAILLSIGASAQIKSATLTASGLTCSMCSKAIYKALGKVSFIQKVDVDIEKSTYLITFKPGEDVSPAALKKAVEGAGFSVAQLKLTADVPAGTLNQNKQFAVQGSNYRIINTTKTPLSGTQTFTIVEKNFLSDAEYKKWLKAAGVASSLGVYNVAL
jgi:copper chaperone CopZ